MSTMFVDVFVSLELQSGVMGSDCLERLRGRFKRAAAAQNVKQLPSFFSGQD